MIDKKIKNKILTCVVLACLLLIIGIVIWLYEKNNVSEEIIVINEESMENDENVESQTSRKDLNMKVLIQGKKYNVTLDNNKTAQSFIEMLPLECNMSELNGNEKYVYLDNTLPTNTYSPKHIESGDLMLFGNNCLVIFYKSFETSYSYTKIGHIDSLDDIGNKDITVKFEME